MQIVRNLELSLMLRKDIKRLTKKFPSATAAIGPRVVLFVLWRGHPDIYDVCRAGANALAIARYIKDFSSLNFEAAKQGNVPGQSNSYCCIWLTLDTPTQ